MLLGVGLAQFVVLVYSGKYNSAGVSPAFAPSLIGMALLVYQFFSA